MITVHPIACQPRALRPLNHQRQVIPVIAALGSSESVVNGRPVADAEVPVEPDAAFCTARASYMVLSHTPLAYVCLYSLFVFNLFSAAPLVECSPPPPPEGALGCGGDQSSDAGLGPNISCAGYGFPVIELNSVVYRAKAINRTRQTLVIAEFALPFVGPACPYQMFWPVLDVSPYGYTDRDRLVALLYDCSAPDPDPAEAAAGDLHRVPCTPGAAGGGPGFFFWTGEFGRPFESSCASVSYAVVDGPALEGSGGGGGPGIWEALQAGFEVTLDLRLMTGVFQSNCEDCIKSGGQCVLYSVPSNTGSCSYGTGLSALTIQKDRQHVNSGHEKKLRRKVLAIAIALLAALALIVFASIYYRRRRSTKTLLYESDHETTLKEIVSVESLLLDLSTLRAATANFAEANKLGQGGFGAVFKGVLPDGREIAVKRLSANSGQGTRELTNELVLVAKLQHRNHVRLLGVSLEGEEKLVVYEYMPNRSLDTFLYDPTKCEKLNWGIRYNIIGGIARGLLYLHEDSQLRIIHRDLKASNILLDADMNPKISDFGLARLFEVGQTLGSTNRIVGTFGYMAPEYAMCGQFSIKSDVYSFGVIVLEIVTGKKNSSFFDARGLPSYVWEQWNMGSVTEIIDPSIREDCPIPEVLRCIDIGVLCVQENPSSRPSMSTVVMMLNNNSNSMQPPAPSRPAFYFENNGMVSSVFSNEVDIRGSAPYEDMGKLTSMSPNELSITELNPR